MFVYDCVCVHAFVCVCVCVCVYLQHQTFVLWLFWLVYLDVVVARCPPWLQDIHESLPSGITPVTFSLVASLPEAWGQYHGGRRPSSDDSFHSPTIIPPSALDKPSIMKCYHRQRTTMVTLHCTRFVECRWWNDGWTVKTVVTWLSLVSMILAPGVGLRVLLLLIPQLYVWGSPFWVRISHMWLFHPAIEVVTFRLCGWCVQGVFLLPPFTCLGHECQGLLSLCDGMYVCTD